MRPFSRFRSGGWRVVAVVFGLLVLAEVLARWTVPLQQRLGLDTRRVSDILSEQTALISRRLADTAEVIVLDSVLGWRNRPGYASPMHDITADGLRGSRAYTAEATPGVLRVSVFGDAYAYGAEVPTDSSWAALLERSTPALEVLNHGVGGFGTDQALLLYLREGLRRHPDVVLIGFAPVNLRRTLTRYTRFLTSSEPPLTKPRFALDSSGGLALIPNPLRTRGDWERLRADPASVREMGAGDEWYDALRYENPLYDRSALVRVGVAATLRVWRKYLWEGRLLSRSQFREQSPAFRIQLTLIRQFSDSVRARGATPVVLLLPDEHSVREVASGRSAVYAPLLDALTGPGDVEIVDLAPALAEHARRHGGEGVFAPGGHYGPAGNAAIAARLGEQLGVWRRAKARSR